jgi:hypothetical protein
MSNPTTTTRLDPARRARLAVAGGVPLADMTRAELRARVVSLELDNYRLTAEAERLAWEAASARAHARLIARKGGNP